MMIVFTILTYFLYLFSKKVYGKIPFPIFQPLLLAPILLIMLITIMHVSANQYLEDAKWLSHMLGPATIAFAVPIYKHFSTIKNIWLPS